MFCRPAPSTLGAGGHHICAFLTIMPDHIAHTQRHAQHRTQICARTVKAHSRTTWGWGGGEGGGIVQPALWLTRLLGEGDHRRDRQALGLENLVARRGEAEGVDAEHLVGVFVPRSGVARLGGGGLRLHRLGQHRLDVLGALPLERLDARHGDDAPALAELLGRVDRQLQLGADTDQDALQLALLLLGDVAALERAGALLLRRARVDHGEVLAREDERGGPVGAGDRRSVRGGSLLGVARAHHVQVGHRAQAGDHLDRLVRRAVLADSDRVVRPDVRNGEAREGGHADRAHHVAREDEEGGARDGVQAVEGHAVEDGAHAVLADAVVEVAAGVVVLGEVADALHVVLVGAVQVGRARQVEGHLLRNRLQHLGTRVARGDARADLEAAHLSHQLLRARRRLLEHRRLVGVGSLPRLEGLLPLVVLGDQLRLVRLEVVVRVGRDVPLLVRRQSERLASRVLVLDARLAVRRAGARDLVDALADDGLAHV
mmetsp:Transcript_14469/g.42539  ORF Transcript_14469/g.42539 Transcript_14469/m.42539 type:complete len:487 (+) Transcript_14469:758-2218(+)